VSGEGWNKCLVSGQKIVPKNEEIKVYLEGH
jgi:hypothetical protein